MYIFYCLCVFTAGFVNIMTLQVTWTMFSVRLVVADHYMSPPIHELDVRYSEFRGTEVKQVTFVRIFGSTIVGMFYIWKLHNCSMWTAEYDVSFWIGSDLNSWSQWPCGLRHRTVAALLLCLSCAECMGVCLLCWLCVMQWADHSFRGILPGVCVCVHARTHTHMSNGLWDLATSKRGRLHPIWAVTPQKKKGNSETDFTLLDFTCFHILWTFCLIPGRCM
jgi:hypothetical protein